MQYRICITIFFLQATWLLPATSYGDSVPPAVNKVQAGNIDNSAFGAAMPAPTRGPIEHFASRKDFLKKMRADFIKNASPDLTPEQVQIGAILTDSDLDEDLRQETLALLQRAKGSLAVNVRGAPLEYLYYAALMADVEMVKLLLDKGVPADNAPADTALMGVVRSPGSISPADRTKYRTAKRLEIIRLLLKAGANPNAKDARQGKTPFDLAMGLSLMTREHGKYGEDELGNQLKEQMAMALLEGGASLNVASLEAAVSVPAVARYMLDRGANPKANGSAALSAAINAHQDDLAVLMIKKGADPNARSISPMLHNVVLVDAARFGQTTVVKALLEAGANPNVCNDEDARGKCVSHGGYPKIYWAAMSPEIFRLAVAKGADINTEEDGRTQLGSAISSRTYAEQGIMKVCMAGTTNCIDADVKTPNRTGLVRNLLEAGADPNKQSGGVLPLVMALDTDHEIITMLLDKGAHMAELSVDGERIGPISQAAADHKDFLAGELLRRSKDKLDSDEKWALYAAAGSGNIDLVEKLVQHGIKLDERGPFGETALHYAAHTGNAAMVRRMLLLGANPNVLTDLMLHITSDSFNPFVFAGPTYNPAKLKIYNAMRQQPPNIEDGKVTPLMLAVASGDVDVTKALLDGGAKTSIKSQHGLTALDIANRMGNPEMQRLLEGSKDR